MSIATFPSGRPTRPTPALPRPEVARRSTDRTRTGELGRVSARPSTAPADRSVGTGNLRLTTRGRVVVVTFVLLAAFGAFLFRSGPADSTSVVHHMATRTVVMQPGETVWDIAHSIAPNADPRPIVAEIAEMNSLSDPGSVRVGSR